VNSVKKEAITIVIILLFLFSAWLCLLLLFQVKPRPAEWIYKSYTVIQAKTYITRRSSSHTFFKFI